MIHILDKKDCCGCSACVQRCPKNCIRMYPDEEGFLYPSIDETLCVDCGLCEKVCPVLNKGDERIPVRAVAIKNDDENIRLNSSSGGAFTALAIKILNEGGVVFGARFNDEWEVVHDYIENADNLHLFRGSKYVQSYIGVTYLQAESFLKNGRKVLFSGTSCQIAGLKRFLGREYENLLTVDVICHGVPSPIVWKDYLDDLISRKKIKGVSSLEDISTVSFRSKVTGWHIFSMEITGRSGGKLSEPLSKNVFMQGFHNNMYLRPSCYDCPARKGKSGSDISLGDYWGVENHHPCFADDAGVGLVLVYNEDRSGNLMELGCQLVESDYASGLSGNLCIENSVPEPLERSLFWKEYGTKGLDAVREIINSNRPGLLKRIVSKLKRTLSVD